MSTHGKRQTTTFLDGSVPLSSSEGNPQHCELTIFSKGYFLQTSCLTTDMSSFYEIYNYRLASAVFCDTFIYVKTFVHENMRKITRLPAS